mmetsp:Transcript_24606/g.62294  ORF Transcript_24606/g.62294 Transcript_24606/m.62294 type:complete len:87 (+) Transcript_24606:610-870(+)
MENAMKNIHAEVWNHLKERNVFVHPPIDWTTSDTCTMIGPFLRALQSLADAKDAFSHSSLSFEESKEVKSGLKQLSSFTASVLQQL